MPINQKKKSKTHSFDRVKEKEKKYVDMALNSYQNQHLTVESLKPIF